MAGFTFDLGDELRNTLQEGITHIPLMVAAGEVSNHSFVARLVDFLAQTVEFMRHREHLRSPVEDDFPCLSA